MDLALKKCIPCEVGTLPMNRDKAEKYLKNVEGWELLEDQTKGGQRLKIKRRFKFDSYMDGVDFVNEVAKIAEEEGHHPDMTLGWRQVTVNLTTHALGGLSENDFIMASKIDRLEKVR